MSDAFRTQLKGSFVVNALGAAAIFISQFFVAHFASVDSFGVFAFVFAFVQILIVVAKFGFDSAVQKLIPQYLAEKEFGRTKGILIGSTLIVLGASVVASLCFAIWGVVSSQADVTRHTILAASLLIPIFVLLKLSRGFLLGFRMTVRAQLFDPLLIYSAWMAVIAIDVLRGIELTPVRIMMQLFFVGCLALIGQFYFAARAVPSRIRAAAVRCDLRRWLGIALPMLLAYGLVAVITYTDTILIGVLLDTDQAGIYAVSARLAATVSMPMAFLSGALAPAVADLVAKKDFQTLQTHLRETARLGLYLAIPVAIVVVFGSAFMLGIVGESYTAGTKAAYVLAAAQFINVLVGPAGLVLLMSGQHREAGRLFALTAALNILLNLMFIPLFGIVGAAVATALAIIFRNLVLRSQLAKVHNLDTSIFRAA